MADLLRVLQAAIVAAFVLLALAALIDWIRHRNTRRGYLALALGSLAVLILIAPTLGQAGALNQLATDVAVVVFLLSGYALLMFRDSFIPLSAATRRTVTIALLAVAALAIVARLPADPQQRQGPLQSIALFAVLIVWGLCIIEPIFRLWLASNQRPAVESARLRALSLGYAALLAVVGVGTLDGAATRPPYFELATDLVALAIVPLLYVSFSPPNWLRWVWRQPEEDAARNALHDLLLYSPDRATLAHRALGWATRIVGGEGAVIVDSDGSILAAQDLTLDQAEKVASGATAASAKGGVRASSPPATRLVIPLNLQQGAGAMIILSGPFTPMFGDDEMLRLRQYAGSITAGLDRVSLNQRLATLEKAKTEFLNVASHELRGPMTVIKGYLTMLDAGSLGDLSSQSKSVLPLLIAKSDEVNWMIEQMVEAARLEEGRLALHKLSADVVELTDLAIEGVSQLLSKHEVSVDKPTRAIQAEVDPDRIQIVVKNLLSNAAKYSPAGARIRVRVSGNGVARVAVSDEGIGIAEEDQARLFTRFVRIQTKATERVSGTGLGLWLSREIARMHDGDLTVESTPGRGSTFTLQLPLNA
ncbi:MAG: HAMP domain-containing histidine kinase [Candidatus Dormibacteraeota bacterium]|nr:HAMP domain-containing histidine kinase [Candidatus Dormibacteraeota bacterium]